jgi:hypothetical protein
MDNHWNDSGECRVYLTPRQWVLVVEALSYDLYSLTSLTTSTPDLWRRWSSDPRTGIIEKIEREVDLASRRRSNSACTQTLLQESGETK